MQCEICGIDIIGSARKVVVEGTQLEVCGRCAQYGSSPRGWSPVSRKIAPAAPPPATRVKRPKRNIFDDLGEEIIADYSRVIREGREAKGLTQEELGFKIKEKASLIRKVERSDIIPEDTLRKKLEHALDIKLTERISRDNLEHGSAFQGTTLGDIVTIKKK